MLLGLSLISVLINTLMKFPSWCIYINGTTQPLSKLPWRFIIGSASAGRGGGGVLVVQHKPPFITSWVILVVLVLLLLPEPVLRLWHCAAWHWEGEREREREHWCCCCCHHHDYDEADGGVGLWAGFPDLGFGERARQSQLPRISCCLRDTLP